MNKTIDYLFVVQQEGRRSLARIVHVDAANEQLNVREIAERLQQGNNGAAIHYARRPEDDTIVIMQRFGDED